MGAFEGRSSFGTWLTSITVDSALIILRKKRASLEIAKARNDDFEVDSPCYQIADHAPNPETRCAQAEEQRILRTAIEHLRPNLRVVVQIHLQGRSMRETAEALGISLPAAKGRLFHAKKALLRSTIGKLMDQPRFADKLRVLRPGLLGRRTPGHGFTIRGSRVREKKGDEDVIEIQGTSILTAPSWSLE